MSKCTEIVDYLGDYAFKVEYSDDNKFMMFFNSRRNAETVKRCIEVDDSVPNAATAVDFVEVVRCKDCIYKENDEYGNLWCTFYNNKIREMPQGYCWHGESIKNENSKDTAAL